MIGCSNLLDKVCSVAILLCLCVCGLIVAFVLSLFVPHFSFFWCLGKVVLRDCNIPGCLYLYEGPAKSSVTNRLPWFYPRYILKCFTALEWCVE